MHLLTAPQMPQIQDILMPNEFYWILKEPALLGGMSYPSSATPWQNIYDAGFHHIVCLTDDEPRYDPAPLSMLHAVKLQDLYGGLAPRDSKREEHLIETAVHAVQGKLLHNEGVVVHCVGGTGRTGTVLGCTLRTLGLAASEVLAYLDELNKARGQAGWPEAAWQADLVERFEINNE